MTYFDNSKIQDIFYKPIDYSTLPENCPAKAAERIRQAYYERKPIDPLDLRIVLGDISIGVSMPKSTEDINDFLLR